MKAKLDQILGDLYIDTENEPYKVSKYINKELFIKQHLEILSSPQGDLLSYDQAENNIDKLQNWLNEIEISLNYELLAIYKNNSLIGTSKISFYKDKRSFSMGILIDKEHSNGRNFDIALKGAILIHFFLNCNYKYCFGGCKKSNFRSVSFYHYFQFINNKEKNDALNLNFELSKEDFINRIQKIILPFLRKNGFETENLPKIWIDMPIADFQGYSSLTYFSMISSVLDIYPNLTMEDIFECNSFSDLLIKLQSNWYLLSFKFK